MTSRRQMLKSSVALAAGALGIGAASKAIGARAGSDPPQARPQPGGRLPKSLELVGRNVHAVSDGRRLGQSPASGDRTALSGEIVDSKGAALGDFFISSTTFAATWDARSAPVVETHTFRLPDGTIHGMGTAADDGESVFAIVGGTGRYLGARGSYVARHMPIELGGDGSAAFTMTFTR
jgi:hypothetical protein